MKLSNVKAGPYWGVDPGKSGAAVGLYLDNDGRWAVTNVVKFEDYDFADIKSTFQLAEDLIEAQCVVGIERVQGMPRQSGPASFNFGRNYGILLGILNSRKRSTILLMPKSAWAFLVGIPFDKRDDKKAAVELAVRLVPGLTKYKNRAGNVPDGIAEAALIAIAAAIQESKQNAVS